MLPDLTGLKRDVSDALTRRLRRRVHELFGFISSIPENQIFEGHRAEIERRSGAREDADPIEVSVEVILTRAEGQRATVQKLLEKTEEMAQAFANQQAKKFLEVVSEQNQRYGQVVDAKQQPLSAELLIRALEMLQIDFNAQGNPELPSMVISPRQSESARQAAEELENEPSLRRRHADLIERKREEWRAREASRNLVG